jgi:hypothetical protein
MRSSLISLVAFAGASYAEINPATVTSLTPQQSTAVYYAHQSLLSSLSNDPALYSVIHELQTIPNRDAWNALTSIVAGPLPTGADAAYKWNSIINEMPADAANYFRSLTSVESAVVSSAINSPAAVITMNPAVPTNAVFTTPKYPSETDLYGNPVWPANSGQTYTRTQVFVGGTAVPSSSSSSASAKTDGPSVRTAAVAMLFAACGAALVLM